MLASTTRDVEGGAEMWLSCGMTRARLGNAAHWNERAQRNATEHHRLRSVRGEGIFIKGQPIFQEDTQ